MMRIEKLSSLFRDCSFLVNNRDPYANCASIFYRNHDPEKISASDRKAAFKMFAQDWVERSNKLKILVNKNNLPKITYEQFCETPSSIFEFLSLPPCVLDSINLSAKVKVKDYEIQSVSNQNERQISYLTNTDMESINSVLKTEVSLLNFFNYKVM